MPADSPVPKNVLRFMLLIVIGFALVAVYANIQKMRRSKLESVTFTPGSVGEATPSPSP